MARPPRIEKLRHGKLLCGSVFRFFVETWNWLVGYVDNMKGDADVNPQAGHITIDRTDPDHPVIRFRADKVAGGKSVTPDDVSTEFIPEPEEGEEPTGDEGKLQIFDFNSNESDSPEGLADRLHADTETGDIKVQSGTNIMLLARRDGKIVYIPLSADGEDPEDEKPYDPENPDPCAHPGDNASGGATSESIDGGGAGGVDGGAGGVPAGGGEPHTGDDDCNCKKN